MSGDPRSLAFAPTFAPGSVGAGPVGQATDPLIGLVLGNYVIERRIAEGGMAIVYAAIHPALGRRIAVKLLSPALQGDRQLEERFLLEARVTASLRHPNVVEIFDFGELHGRTYYTMELLEGEDLAGTMEQRGRLAPDLAVATLAQICAALEAAHRVGVIHRDLKPSNVFVLDRSPLCVKLMDFGVAKVNGTDHVARTRAGQVLGTPTHMSPEQALGQSDRIGPRTDLYALGVIGFELLTGRLPFESDSEVLLMTMHIKDPVPSIRALCPDVPAEVAKLVERCLEKDSARRPASAGELRQALEGSLPGPIAVSLPAPELIPSRAPALAPVATRVDAEREAVRARIRARSRITSSGSEPLVASARPNPRVVCDTVIDGGAASERSAPERKSTPEIAEANENDSEGSWPPLVSEPAAARLSSDPVAAPAEGRALERLLRRIERKGDLPSFLNNMAEITMKADANARYSAAELGEAIMKDYALTAKLLRVVNLGNVNTFGGKVYSVNQAIVILGFDSVRTIALGVSVFKMPGSLGSSRHKAVSGPNNDELAESAIRALISGELARFLAPLADIGKLAELCMMCAMFRGLGKQLLMQYLPDEYQRVKELQERNQRSLSDAARQVLGSTLEELSVGVAEHWKLPKQIRVAMATNLPPNSKLEREEDRLSAVSRFAGELCEIVAEGNRATWNRQLERLLNDHTQLLALDVKDVPALLGMACKSFEDRYAALFGPYGQRSRFLQSARTMGGESPDAVLPVQPPLSEREQQALAGMAQKINTGLQQRRDRGELLQEALPVAMQALAARRLVLLVTSSDRKSLSVRAAVGTDVDAIAKFLEFPLARGADTFANALKSGKSVTMLDTLAPSAARTVPQKYYELVRSPAFGLYPCASMGYPTCLLLVDTDFPEALPSEERVAATRPLRELLAKVAHSP